MKKLLSLLIILGILAVIIKAVWPKFSNGQKIISPSTLPVAADLKTAVENALAGSKGTYSIVIKNLKNGEAYYKDEHKIFEPGSLYKIWLMAEVYNELQNGKISRDEVLTQDVSVLNKEFDIDPDNAELADGTMTLSVGDALEQMITISHNYSALLLAEKIGLSSVERFLVRNNFEESTIGEAPKTTASDIALFFEKLYKSQLADEKNSKEMLDLLKRQTFNNKLSKYLPKDVQVAHKTGEIAYLSHDAGIVFTPKGDYIIVILSDTDFPPGAEERIALISQAVYKYFYP